MTRPPVEVADILRIQGDCFREQNRSWLGYQQLACCGPSPDAARLRSEVIWIPARDVISKPSLIIRAATGTARSVRPRRASAGWRGASRTCSPCPTSMSSLLCLTR